MNNIALALYSASASLVAAGLGGSVYSRLTGNQLPNSVVKNGAPILFALGILSFLFATRVA